MDLRQLKYFTVIVEEGTISAAARRLHISQPPLSYQMRLLEQEYGVELFRRGARQITLTDAGRRLYQYAREILELSNAAGDELKSLQRGQAGIVRLGWISSACSSLLFEKLKTYQEKNRRIQFKIEEGNTFELIDDLHLGKIDLAVIRMPFYDTHLIAKGLGREEMRAAGSEKYMRRLKEDIALKDLSGMPLIVYKRWEQSVREAMIEEELQADFFCVCEDARTALEWAQEELGIAIVPASVLSFLPLNSRRLREEKLNSELCLVRQKELPLSFQAEALWQCF